MAKKEIVIIADYSEEQSLNLEELCEICHISADFLQELIAYEIIHPKKKHSQEWKFDLTQLRRVQIAQHLQHDLEVNVPGVALALDLLEQLKEMRAQLEIIERHYKRNDDETF